MGDTTEDLEARFPGWHVWRSVTRRHWYARRPKSSPPKVLRADSAAGLAAELESYKAQQDRWDQRHN